MNYSNENMPNWIATVITNEAADIIALTEVYKGNNWNEVKTVAINSNYVVFETSNNTAGQNDIVIAININKLNVIYAKHIIRVLWEFQTALKLNVKARILIKNLYLFV